MYAMPRSNFKFDIDYNFKTTLMLHITGFVCTALQRIFTVKYLLHCLCSALLDIGV